jgi:PAS domain S-box-containing protein/diguanylate cyclase (GGDEF)-like protein
MSMDAPRGPSASSLVERLAYLGLLERAASASNEQPTFFDAAAVVLREVCSFTGWPAGHLCVVEPPEPQSVVPTGVWHLDDPDRFDALRRVTDVTSFSLGEGLPGRVAANGRPAWITDVSCDDNFPRSAMVPDLGVGAAFAFPVLVGPEVVAVLEFFTEDLSEPNQALLDVLAAVGGQLARVVERDRAHAALRQSEERFRALAQSAPDAIVTADRRGVVTSWNEGAQRMFGWSEAEIVGQPLTVLMPERLRAAHLAGLERYLATARRTVIGRTVELAAERRDGSEFPVELSLSTWTTGEGRFFTGIIRDISERKHAEEERRSLAHQLDERALRDPLTGLPNRALFVDRLRLALARAGRVGLSAVVLFCDLDRFRSVNESFGHEVGDELIMAVVGRLESRMRPGDTVARMGGDEFAVLGEDLGGPAEAAGLAREVQEVFASPFTPQGIQVWMTASTGVALGSGGGDADLMLREAVVAAGRAKQRGRGRVEVFDDAMREAAPWHQVTEHELRDAIAGGQLRLVYQPIVALADAEVVGVEALVRWDHPSRGLLGPGDFIPLAEESRLVVPLGRWVLHEACLQAAAWQAARAPDHTLTLSVNVSVQQFRDDAWAADVAAVLAATGLPARRLVLEITESTLMDDSEVSAQRLAELRRLGVRLAVDDFGTGYSSLSYLRRMPVDFLKIDKSFVDGVTGDAHESALARAVVKLSSTLGLVAIAEGIERQDQAEALAALGCRLGQGFWLGRPANPEEIGERLGER